MYVRPHQPGGGDYAAMVYQLNSGANMGGTAGQATYGGRGRPMYPSASQPTYPAAPHPSAAPNAGMYTVNAGVGPGVPACGYYPNQTAGLRTGGPLPNAGVPMHSDPNGGFGFMGGNVLSMPIPHGTNGAPHTRGGRGRGRGGAGRANSYGRGSGAGAGAHNAAAPVCEGYEAHDNQLKAPIAVSPSEVIPTTGSMRLFSGPQQSIVYGSRNVFRICEAFQEGRCAAGDKCNDIHVLPESLNATRQQMTAWLQTCEDDFNRITHYDPTHTFRIFVTDLKEVVDVPAAALTFTKGLYVDPTTRARRTRAAHGHSHGGGGSGQSALATQVPTGCGLYANDPSQCKWGRWCNQVHIDPSWMREKKEGFQQWFEKLESDFNAYTVNYAFTVHDPQLKMNLKLPKFSIADFTRGLFQGSNKKAPSVCLLFQKGRCTAGSCCNQIHIHPDYLRIVRALVEESGADPYGQPVTTPTGRELEKLSVTLIAKHEEEQRGTQLPLPMSGGAEGAGDAADASGDQSGPDSCMGDYDGALFEHIQVDEDSLDVINPTQLAGMGAGSSTNEPHGEGVAAFNHSTNTHVKTIRHFNPDGSYTNNPYGSLTSLPEASGSYGSRNVAVSPSSNVCRTTGADLNNASTSSYTRALAASSAYAAGSKVRTTVRLPTQCSGSQPPSQLAPPPQASSSETSPHVGMPYFFPSASQGSGGNFNTSMTGSNVAGASGSTSGNWGTGTGGGAAGTYPAGARGSVGARSRPYVHNATSPTGQALARGRDPIGSESNAPLNRSHTGPEHLFTPQEFDSSLHFSPSPLLGLDASNTSATRNLRGDDDFNYSNVNVTLRMGGANAPTGNSYGYSANSSTTTGGSPGGTARGGAAAVTTVLLHRSSSNNNTSQMPVTPNSVTACAAAPAPSAENSHMSHMKPNASTGSRGSGASGNGATAQKPAMSSTHQEPLQQSQGEPQDA